MRSIILLAVWTVLSAADPAPTWPQFRGPQRNGISPETGWTHAWPAEGPKKLWSAQVGLGFSSVAISEGRLYTQGNTENQDSIWCLDAATGAVKWQHRYACDLHPKYYSGGTSATPAVADGAVYTLSKSGHLFCLDAATGAVRWSKELPRDFSITPPTWGFASSPLVDGKLLLLNVGLAGLALDRTTGETAWTSGVGACGYASPVAYSLGATRYVVLFGGAVLNGVDIATGAVKWTIPWKTDFGENSPDPVIDGTTLFVSSGHGLGSALYDLGDGGQPVQRWTNKELGNHVAASVLWQGHYYGFTGRVNKDNGGFGCVEAATGTTKWFIPKLRGALTMADGRLIILTLQSELVIAAAEPAAYRELARAQVLPGTSWTAPVLCGGRMYVRNSKGELACLEVGGR